MWYDRLYKECISHCRTEVYRYAIKNGNQVYQLPIGKIVNSHVCGNSLFVEVFNTTASLECEKLECEKLECEKLEPISKKPYSPFDDIFM